MTTQDKHILNAINDPALSELAAQFANDNDPHKMQPSDPAYWMLHDGFTTTPVIHKEGCYICEDPEYAQMGLPLCRKCPKCGGHIAADDSVCDDCGYDEMSEIDE